MGGAADFAGTIPWGMPCGVEDCALDDGALTGGDEGVAGTGAVPALLFAAFEGGSDAGDGGRGGVAPVVFAGCAGLGVGTMGALSVGAGASSEDSDRGG